MDPNGPRLSVVVVSWNAAHQLPSLLSSLTKQDIGALEVVAVDNASKDASVEVLHGGWSGVSVIRLERNAGFAAAADQGIAATTGQAVALLNTDLVLHPGYLSRCLAALEADPRLGSVQGLLLRPGRAVIDSAGHMLTRGRWARNRGENQPVKAGAWAPAATFGVTAGAAVYRREMLDQAREVCGHVFDPAFFAYLEDVDLDWRARWLGWESAVVDGATAEHVHSGSGARTTAAVQRHIIKNRLLVLYRNEDGGSLLRDLPWVAGQMLARWALALVTSPASLLGVVDFLRLLPVERRFRAAIRRSRRLPPAALRRWYGIDSSRMPLTSRTPSPAPSQPR